jgi:hypothetical protein
MQWRRRWRTRAQAEAELDEEVRFHLREETERQADHGAAPDEAARTAHRLFGNVTEVRQATQSTWRFASLRAAFREAARMTTLKFLVRQRAYVAICLTTLSLAIGANLVVFTIVNAVWLRPRPVHDPATVVIVTGDAGSTGSSETFFFAEGGLQNWVRDVPAFSGVAGQVMTSGIAAALRPRIMLEQSGRTVETLGVTPEYFSVLGLPILGRDFTSADDRYSSAPVAIISDRLWRSAFGGRAEIIGRTVDAKPMPLQIIGIAPADFGGARLGENADMWIPRNLVPRVSSVPMATDGLPGMPEGAVGMIGIARLRPSVSVAEAQRLVNKHNAPRPERLVVVPLASVFGSPEHRTLIVNEDRVLSVISLTAALVLLGGCATLMAVVLVHYERRRRELATRLALGASGGRLLRRLVAELAWLVSAGCAGALLLTYWSIGAVPALDLPEGISLARVDLSIDWRVAAAALAATSVTMVLAACVPLMRFSRDQLARDLVGSSATPHTGSLRVRKVMLGAHVAATVVVLVAASLFIRAVQHGFSRGAGFDADRTLFVSAQVGTPYDASTLARNERLRGLAPAASLKERMATTARRSAELKVRWQAVSRRLLTALEDLPGIIVLAIGRAPLGLDQSAQLAQPRFVETGDLRLDIPVASLSVTPAFIDAMGLEVTAGRPLSASDVRRPGVAIPVLATASLTSKLWPGQSPLGRRVHASYEAPRVEYEIVGVVRDFAFGSLRYESPAVFITAMTLDDAFSTSANFVIRTASPEQLKDPIRRIITDLVPDSPHVSIATGRELIAVDLGRERLGAWLFSGFGLVALVLGVVSVFGLVAYLAESRLREFGVRIALGATPANILKIALSAGLAPATVGVVIGLSGAAGLAKMAESFLVGIGRFDYVSYLTATAIALLATAAAGLAGARRLRRNSPLDALRAE